MPATECQCNTCGHHFRHLTFKGDRINPLCPRCKNRDITIQTDPERFMADASLGSLITGIPKGPS